MGASVIFKRILGMMTYSSGYLASCAVKYYFGYDLIIGFEGNYPIGSILAILLISSPKLVVPNLGNNLLTKLTRGVLPKLFFVF